MKRKVTSAILLLMSCTLLASCSIGDFFSKKSNESTNSNISSPSNQSDSNDSSISIGDASFSISAGDFDLNICDSVNLTSDESDVEYRVLSGEDYGQVKGNVATGLNPGTFTVIGIKGNENSNLLTFNVNDVDPYQSMSSTVFYSNYTQAISYSDAKYRSKHYFMSGSLDSQEAQPTIASNQPIEDDKYVRNSKSYYSQSGNAYTIVDKDGNEVDKIYKDGAYITLDQVAAYVFAFCSTPANTVASTGASPSSSKWSQYLRVNDNNFGQNTSKYPYQPLLPSTYVDSSGVVRSILYHEMDIGTTGTPTNSNQSYPIGNYNNGKKIIRGAARIVYAYTTSQSIDYHYVFYTYNHYNDFQEYLNYYQGWGERFGQESNGGSYNAQDGDPNPSPYVETIRRDL